MKRSLPQGRKLFSGLSIRCGTRQCQQYHQWKASERTTAIRYSLKDLPGSSAVRKLPPTTTRPFLGKEELFGTDAKRRRPCLACGEPGLIVPEKVSSPLSVLMTLSSVGDSLESSKSPSPSQERYNFFDAELFQILNQKEEANVLISPISIKLVLGMLMEGAEDRTAEEIRTALRLPDEEDARRKEFSKWLSALQSEESANNLKIANRLFLSDQCSVNSTYGKALRKYYSGGITGVKFEEPKEASRVINSWVADQTSRLIPSIVEEGQLSPNNKLMLASAVYFKGVWSRPFASGRTAIRCFYTTDNQCKDSLVMTETGYFDYGYIRSLDAKAIVLPYKGGKFSMLLLLPSRRDGIKLLGRDVGHVSLSAILSELKEEEVLVQIPQFEISYNDDLVESLKNVQVSEVFTRSANLSRIFNGTMETVPVRHIYHSAKIVVNEEGSEAAAATGALFVPLMGGTTTSFVANHPFLFFVINSANSILFAGKVALPQTSAHLKKTTLSSASHTAQAKKTVGQGLSATPSPRNDTAQKNSSGEFVKSTEKYFAGTRHHHRGQQQPMPKFRSIMTALPLLRTPPNERGAIESSVLPSPTLRGFISHPGDFFERDGHRKRGKTAQDLPTNRKRQELPPNDWRHRVLIFT